ncbi:hypothetical protein [Pseudomonas sp.]|uniref:hypothetical protein n=1 Tax=Pseudomonas sp. TaxID=306 RepID=UPI0028B0D945|nr:hypothetical protein [Pseudomonas sp.]
MKWNESVFMRQRCLSVVILLSPSLAFAAPADVCGDARAVLQCEVAGDGALAVCGSFQGDTLQGLQYRFARKGVTELEYPNAGFSLKDFNANHYVRYQVDYSLIKFTSAGYTYGVYSNYDGEADEARVHTAGVAVTNAAGVEVANKRCTKVLVDDLQQVIPHLTCDPDDAVGCL